MEFSKEIVSKYRPTAQSVESVLGTLVTIFSCERYRTFLTLSSSIFMPPITPLNPMSLYHSKNVSVVNSTQSNNPVTKLANP